MATKLKLKKSSVAGKVPLAGDLEYGELAINYADGRLYYKNDSNQIRSFLDSGQVLSSAFKTIKVAGDSDLVAVGEDTLEIKAGDFIDLNTSNNDSPNAKSLTITVDSAVLRTFIDSVTSQDSIGHFINVDTNGVQDGQALVWDSDLGVFSPGTVAGAGGGFATINVTGSETVRSDSSGNAVRFTAGSGMTITSDSASKSITFASTGGGGGGSVAADVTLNSFTGDSSTTAYTLGAAPVTDQNVFVTINGVSQHVDAYTLNSNVLTFDSAPGLGDAIETRIITAASVSLRDHTDYIYQPNPETYVLTGADINSNTLAYDIGKIEVFLNGSRLTPGLDYTATDGTSVTLLTDYEVDSSDTVVISSFGKAYLIDRGVVPNQEDGDSAAVQLVVDQYDASIYRTSKYIVQLMHDSDNKYHATEVLLTHNGTDVFMTEYGEVKTDSSLGTIDADILSGNVRLLVTPSYSNTSVKTQRITVGA